MSQNLSKLLKKEQTSALQTVHFSKELESTIPETVDELKIEEIAKLKRQNSQMEIDFEEKLEKSQENINQMKDKINFLANINQQFDDDSGTELEIISSKRPKGRKLKSKKIIKTNKGKRVFGNDSEEEDIESDDEKNEKGARNEMKTIIKTIDSEFSLDYNQTFTSVNNCEIRHKLILELQKSLALKFRLSVTQLMKWLNSIHKSQRATAQMRNSGKLPKNLRRVHVNNRQNDLLLLLCQLYTKLYDYILDLEKICRIKVAKELFKKNNSNIINYNKESLLRILADRAFHSSEMSDTGEEDNSKTVVNVYDLSWRSLAVCGEKICRIKVAKELFKKNNSNIINYNKESLLRILADRAFHSSEMSDTGEEDNSKTVVNVYDLSWRSLAVCGG
ncbi:hypothetical protein Glove_26g55 [Diversispora epigaea]|uniref:Uncharacterized protein n=1 Tax=Diversispora epigaea TaxID=1348612 RepID=A0A397JKG6_9GLOM|nr:hypothetical protein Glove_26g55 [Diversispora epigaea]